MRNIIKRDGTVRPYEPEKIITAMGKAFREMLFRSFACS